VRYGLTLPTGGECGDPRFLLELAERAEPAGWDGIFLEDYVVFQGDRRAPTTNTWTALAAMAVRTERVALGVTVTPLARRRPWSVAREAAAVDQLSGGRMILGVGLGDTGEHVVADASFTAFGEEREPRRRAQMLDEALEIISGLWTGEPFSFKGEHYSVDDVTFAPLPVQRPRIPIWVGGGFPLPGPTRRAARWDGACMYRERTHHMVADDVRALRAAVGDRPYDVKVGGTARGDDPGAERDRIAELREAGLTWWSEYVPADTREAMRAAVDVGPLRID
jgi:alkanesulfonate monooxygenase SsuD/methylene tetrahydromethanopterin reductase-like flavin-dependent oxidoreductase (luciferase family)